MTQLWLCLCLNMICPPAVPLFGQAGPGLHELIAGNCRMLSALPPMQFRFTTEASWGERQCSILISGSKYYLTVEGTPRKESEVTKRHSFVYAHDGEKYYFLDRIAGRLEVGREPRATHRGALSQVPLIGCFAFLNLGRSIPGFENPLEYMGSAEGWQHFAEKVAAIETVRTEDGEFIEVLQNIDSRPIKSTRVFFDRETLFPMMRKDVGEYEWVMRVVEKLEISGAGGARIILPVTIDARHVGSPGKDSPAGVSGEWKRTGIDRESIKLLEAVPVERFRIASTEAASIYDTDLQTLIKAGDKTAIDTEGSGAEK